MKKILLLLIFLAFSSISLYSQNEVTLLDYKITFLGVDNDFSSNQSTWKYKVSTVNSAKDLSHWIIGICDDHNVAAFTPANSNTDKGYDKTTTVYGFKFDDGVNVGNEVEFTITLDGIYEQTSVEVGVKTGGNPKKGEKKFEKSFITGPSCEQISYKASLGNFVWEDKNKDGIQNQDESGLKDVVVKLYKCDGKFVKATTTDDDGYYLFENLTPQAEYFVKFELLEGYHFTSKNSGGNDNLDSDADLTSGETECVYLDNNEENLSLDAGMVKEENENCATSANISILTDSLVCELEPQVLDVTGNIEITPNPSKAKVIFKWKILSPENEDTDTSLHIEEKEITSSYNYNLSVLWPGVNDNLDEVELYFEVEVRDCDSNLLGNKLSKTFVWNSNDCPPPANEKYDLEIEKSSSSIDEGSKTFEYRIKVKNNGPANAEDVKVLDILPEGVDFISADGDYNNSTGIWNVGNLEANKDKELTITVKLDQDENIASTIDLGVAKDYNLFVFYDLIQPSSDTEGRVAVGRDATLSNYSIGDKLQPGSNLPALVVNRNLNFTSGDIFNGDVYFGKSSNIPDNQRVGIVGGEVIKGRPIDFSAARNELLSLSQQLKNLDTNGTVTYQWGETKLVGNDPLFNIFKVDGNQLSNSHTIRIIVPNGATALINISGTSIELSGGLFIEGTNEHNVLYNFYQAKTLKVSNIDLLGSVLAPKADLDFPTGVINGQVIVKSVGKLSPNSGQFNNKLFVGNIPNSFKITNVASIISPLGNDLNPDNNSSSIYNDFNFDFDDEDNSYFDNNWEKENYQLGNEIIWTTCKVGDVKYFGSWGGKIYELKESKITQINPDMNVAFIWDLDFDASTGILYASTEKGVYKFTNNTWNLWALEDKDVRSLVIFNGSFYAGTWGEGVLKMVGNTWNSVSDDLNTAVHCMLPDGNNLFIGTFGGGVYKLNISYGSLTQSSSSYPFIWSLVKSNGKLFAGTFGGGLYYSEDDGENWNKLTQFPSNFVYALSAGSQLVSASTWNGGVYSINTSSGNNFLAKITSNQNLEFIGLNGRTVSSLSIEDNIITAVTRDGEFFTYKYIPTSVNKTESLPKEYKLEQNYPNPFNPSTTIKFAVTKAGNYQLTIYNALGQEVARLLNGNLNAGNHSVRFDASNLSSGIYFYRLTGSNVALTKKMILMK